VGSRCDPLTMRAIVYLIVSLIRLSHKNAISSVAYLLLDLPFVRADHWGCGCQISVYLVLMYAACTVVCGLL